MGKADLHIHTSEGDGLESPAAVLDHVSGTDLDVIAITEHDDLTVALRARELWARRGYRFDFVTGAEVTTLQGHIVALFIEEPVPGLRPLEETLDAIHRQDGLCFIPHPMGWLTRSLGRRTIERVLSRRDDGLWFDGIEVANPSPTALTYKNAARRLNAARFRLAPIGASDAHFREAIGCAYTQFKGSSAADLKAALSGGNVVAKEGRFPSVREVGLLRLLRVPIAGLGVTPRKMGWRRTTWSFVRRYVP